jgi:hypothetical protein
VRNHTRFPGIAFVALLLVACTDRTHAERTAVAGAPSREAAAARTPAAPSATDTAPAARWGYRLTDGWLSNMEGYSALDTTSGARDYPVENRGQCTGQAAVRRCADGNCWTWHLTDVQCTGKGSPKDTDWLHSQTEAASVCRRDTAWEVASDIPGRGGCLPRVVLDGKGEPARIELECEWACRDLDFPCRGGARYELLRDSGRRVEPGSRPDRSLRQPDVALPTP